VIWLLHAPVALDMPSGQGGAAHISTALLACGGPLVGVGVKIVLHPRVRWMEILVLDER
jgi:hypothetical protein